MKIIIAGYGFVGKAVYEGLKDKHELIIVDPKYTNNTINNHVDADGIIICVNALTGKNGIMIESVVNVLDQVPSHMPVLIKSTVTPAVVNVFKELYTDHCICYNPEFLRANTAVEDFLNQKYIVIGGDDPELLWHNLFINTLPNCKTVFKCSAEEACLIKYATNSFLAVKVSFFNQIFDICNKTGMDYNTVRDIVTQDLRIGASHTVVPGYGNTRGFGGDCLPKDTVAFVHWAKHYNAVPTLVESAIQYNIKVRKNS
jgi:nucleotide sugar dehydrogenase